MEEMNKKDIGIKLLKKLNDDNTLDFDVEVEYFKHGSNIKTFNCSLNGSYDYSIPTRMEAKDKKILSKYFKEFEFIGRYSDESGFGIDGYLWNINFDSIKENNVNEYLKEEIITMFQLGIQYKLLEDFVYDEYRALKKGSTFEVVNIGSGWNDHREFRLFTGFYKCNKSASINEHKAEPDGSSFFSYDPCGMNMPKVKKIKGAIKKVMS